MRLPDTLRPYASMIKWGLIAVLSAFLFVAGCNHGENRSDKTITRLEADVVALQHANASWAAAAVERNKIVEDNVRESDRVQKAGERGAADLKDSREDTGKLINDNQRKLNEAIRDPKCSELLEMRLCPTVPLP